MKLLILSDIHGSATCLNQVLQTNDAQGADHIVLLGDLLYHGARNPLPEGYDPKETAAILNRYADRIIAVRGNCDSEVDQMVLEFPLMAEYSFLLIDGRRFFLTHGHIHTSAEHPPLQTGDVFLSGHTHIPIAEKNDGIYYFNPGSTTLPKEDNPNSYGVLEDSVLTIKDLNGNIIKKIDLQ